MATVEQLRAVLPNVPASRRDFATSLVQWHDSHGRWSARQQFFVDQIVEQCTAAATDALAVGVAAHVSIGAGASVSIDGVPVGVIVEPEPELSPEGVSTVLGWFANVRRVNPRGRARITFPRASVGQGVRLSAPSPTSRYSAADTIFVHAEREYAGRITNGRFVSAGRHGPLLSTLRAVLADPLQATISAGRATGNCCFCARELTDERSVSVGYGPICADHYGLPWGEASPGSRVQNERDALRAEAAVDRAARGDVARVVIVDPATGMERALGMPPVTPNVSAQFERLAQRELGALRRARERAAAAPAAAPVRPDLPSYEDGGPDDEDRAFM